MRLPKFQHLAPTSLPEALSLHAQHKDTAVMLAGGTDLVVRLRQRVVAPAFVMSLNRVPDLDHIVSTPDGGLRIGPMATIHSIETSPAVKRDFGLLAEAANKIASPQIRNFATIGGNLCLDTRCWFYDQSAVWRQSRPPCFKTGGTLCHVVKHGTRCYALFKGDMTPALIALGCTVKLARGAGKRIAPLERIYTGDGQNPLTLGRVEMITGVGVPPQPAGAGTSYMKFSLRMGLDFAIATIAARVVLDAGGACAEARVALGSVASAPVRAHGAENVLKGSRLSEDLLEKAAEAVLKDIGPVVSIGAPVDYKRKITKHLAHEGIAAAWKKAVAHRTAKS